MPTLFEQIGEATKLAMKARERERVAALRLITSEVRRIEIDKRVTLDDPGVIGVLAKMIKQRNDSIAQYRQAGRDELAAAEQYEIEVISTFMPQPLSDEALEAAIADAVKGVDGGPQAMGRVMAVLKPQLEGRADMSKVSMLVKKALSAAV